MKIMVSLLYSIAVLNIRLHPFPHFSVLQSEEKGLRPWKGGEHSHSTGLVEFSVHTFVPAKPLT